MKRTLNIFKIAIAGAVLINMSACSKALDRLADMNKPTTNPTSASSETLLTQSEFSGIMLEQGSFAYDGDGDGFLGIFNQHQAGNHAQGVDFNGYVLTHGSFSFLFNDAYVSSLMNLKLLIENAKSNEVAYVGIAQILQAYQLGYLTSVYGDIPWTQALQPLTFPHAQYDAQTDIYAVVQKLLTSGVQNLKVGVDNEVNGDIIFGGDLDKWAATAYLLKARFYNHFSKKDPGGSATSALLYVDSALNAGFAANEDAYDFTLPYDGLTGYTTNPWVGQYQNGMLCANTVFLDSMKAQDDPRINAYWSSIDGVTGNDVYGIGKSIDQVVASGDHMTIGTDPFNYFGNANSPVLLATYYELRMIEAEAALRAGDASRAATAHNAGIAAQINLMLSLPASKASDKAKVAPYLAIYASETAGTITLEKIMTEKHKLMFTLEAESWMDVRRMDYKYPSWLQIPVKDASKPSPVPVASQFIQRLLYPQSELDRNAANVPNTTIFDKLPILQ